MLLLQMNTEYSSTAVPRSASEQLRRLLLVYGHRPPAGFRALHTCVRAIGVFLLFLTLQTASFIMLWVTGIRQWYTGILYIPYLQHALVDCCCCCSHINSHNQVRGHRTGPRIVLLLMHDACHTRMRTYFTHCMQSVICQFQGYTSNRYNNPLVECDLLAISADPCSSNNIICAPPTSFTPRPNLV